MRNGGNMKTIKVCGDKAHPPYEYLDENKKNQGFAYEISMAIAKELDLEMDISLLNWKDALNAFENDEYDIMQFFAYEAGRAEHYLFTTPILTTFQTVFSLVERDDIEDFYNGLSYRIAVQEYDAAHVMMMVNNHQYKELKVTKSQGEALELLINKEVDIIIGNRQTVSYISSSLGYGDKIKIVGKPLNMTKYCMATKPGNYELLNLLNQGIENIKKNGEFEKIYEKWFIDRSASFGYELLSRMDSGAIYIDALGKIKAVNENAERILSIKEEDLKYKKFYETDYTNVFKPIIIQEILDGRSEILHTELETVINGEEKILEIHYNRMADEEYKTIGVVVSLIDVTEKKMFQEMLAEKDKMEPLGFLLLNIAHEIRNPLTSIKNFIELLPTEYDDVEFRESLFYHVPNQIKQIDEMLTNLLEYSRPVKGERITCSVSEILKGLIIESIIKTTNTKDVRIDYDLEEDMYLECDKNHIKQILINLLLNAAQAVPKGGNIKIKAKKKKQYCIISIINDIPKGTVLDKDKLFEPFYTTKAKGTGLGLFITYQLVKENGGEIKVVQTNDNVRISLIFEGVKPTVER